MAARVQVIIDAKDNTGGVFKNITSSFTEMKSAIDVAAQVLQKLKQGYDFAKEGAQIEFTALKFDRLAKTIGTTGDALKDKMLVATKGTLSEMEAMATATDLVSLGLVRTEKDTVRLATVVAGLGMDMNQLVLTLANKTTMRFDQLGVAVIGFDEKVKKLKDTGLSADDAFTEAFLQQAEEQLVKVGNAADTTAGDFLKFEAQLKDVRDETKLVAAEIAGPLVGALADALKANREFGESLKEVNPQLAESLTWQQLANPELRKMVENYDRAQETGDSWQRSLEAQNAALERNAAALSTAEMSTEQFDAAMKELNTVLRGDLMKAQEDYNQKIEEYRAKLVEARTEKEKDQINANIAAETAAYNERAEAIAFNIQQEAILNSQLPPEEKIGLITALGVAYGEYDEQTAKTITTTQEWISQLEDGNITTQAAIGYLLGVTNNLKETGNAALETAGKETALNDVTVHLAARGYEAGTALGALKGAQAELGDGIRSNALPAASALKNTLAGMPPSGSSWSYYFDISVSGKVPRVPSRDQGGYCFVGGTLVTLADGTRRRIEEIQAGDAVRSYDTNTMEFTDSVVVQTFRHEADGYLNIDGLLVTPEHPLWTLGGEWVKAGEIQPGAVLFRDYGGMKVVQRIFRVDIDVTVYNLEVDGTHTYFAGGVLVHNKEAELFGSQSGGAVYAGNPVLVGEAGAEPFIPSVNGRILGHAESLHALTVGNAMGGRGGGNTNYFYGPVTVASGGDSPGDIMDIR